MRKSADVPPLTRDPVFNLVPVAQPVKPLPKPVLKPEPIREEPPISQKVVAPKREYPVDLEILFDLPNYLGTEFQLKKYGLIHSGWIIQIKKLLKVITANDTLVRVVSFTNNNYPSESKTKFNSFMAKVSPDSEVRIIEGVATPTSDPVDLALIDYLVHLSGNVRRVAIVSGDADYLETFRMLVQKGIEVTVISMAGKNSTMSSAYEEEPGIEVIDIRAILGQIIVRRKSDTPSNGHTTNGEIVQERFVGIRGRLTEAEFDELNAILANILPQTTFGKKLSIS